MTYGAVIIETRPLENLAEIIKRHVKYLPKQWQTLVFCSKENEHLLPDNCKKVVLPEAFMSINEYNRLLTSMWFWNNIPFEKVLIFQHDSEIFRKWDKKFEQWDYIGAPWTFQRHGGNGGLSWRSVDAMKFCIGKTEWIPVMGNEDVYFCNILNNTTEYKLADRMTCLEFACETVFQPNTFGAHAIDKWLTKEECDILRGVKSEWIACRTAIPKNNSNVIIDQHGREVFATFDNKTGFKVNGQKVYKISRYKYVN